MILLLSGNFQAVKSLSAHKIKCFHARDWGRDSLYICLENNYYKRVNKIKSNGYTTLIEGGGGGGGVCVLAKIFLFPKKKRFS